MLDEAPEVVAGEAPEARVRLGLHCCNFRSAVHDTDFPGDGSPVTQSAGNQKIELSVGLTRFEDRAPCRKALLHQEGFQFQKLFQGKPAEDFKPTQG